MKKKYVLWLVLCLILLCVLIPVCLRMIVSSLTLKLKENIIEINLQKKVSEEITRQYNGGYILNTCFSNIQTLSEIPFEKGLTFKHVSNNIELASFKGASFCYYYSPVTPSGHAVFAPVKKEGILNVDYNHFWIYSEKGIRNTRTFIFGNGERRRLSDDKINWYKQMTTEDVKWEQYLHSSHE